MPKQLSTGFYFPWHYFMCFAPPSPKWPLRYKLTVSVAGSSFRNDARASVLATRTCSSPGGETSFVPARRLRGDLALAFPREEPGCGPTAACCPRSHQCSGTDCPVTRQRTFPQCLSYQITRNCFVYLILRVLSSRRWPRKWKVSELGKVQICGSYHKAIL